MNYQPAAPQQSSERMISRDEFIRHADKVTRLETEFYNFSVKVSDDLSGISKHLERIEASRPPGIMQLVTGLAIVSSLLAALVTAVIWIATSITEPRLQLLEYRFKVISERVERRTAPPKIDLRKIP